MSHAINQTLLVLHANQRKRVAYALEGLRDDVFTAKPGNDCNSIEQIGGHVLHLHAFMLMLLDSPLAEQVDESAPSVEALQANLAAAGELLAQGIAEHDPADWHADAPTDPPRPGPWSDEPTLARFTRPFNDLTNHVGGIRAIRRILGNPAERTQ